MSTDTAPAAGTATRATFKGHDRPTQVWFFGTHTKGPRRPGILVNVAYDNGPKMTDATTGEVVSYLSPPAKFWAAPVVEQAEATPPAPAARARLTPPQVHALTAAAAECADYRGNYGAATHGTWYALHRLGLIEDKHTARATDLGRAWLRTEGLLPTGEAVPKDGLMADRFGEDWATQVEPVAAPYYARTFSATTRHIIKPGDNTRTLCGRGVTIPDEYIGKGGKLARPASWMILDLPPCGKCARSEAARGLVPPARTALSTDTHGTQGHSGTPDTCEACHAERFGWTVSA